PKKVFDELQAQLAANRSQFYRDLPEGPFYGYNRPGAKASEAVIANGRRQGALRWHRRLLADRLHRRPQENHRSGAGHAWRRRSNRSLRRRRTVIGEAFEERDLEDLQGLSAWHAHHGSGHHQRRPARVHQGLTRLRL